VILYARDGKNDLDLTEDKVHLGTGGAAVKILDMETGLPRSSTLKDLYDLGRLVDRLDHIHFFLRPCIPTDIPEADYDVNMFYACLKATGKHVMSGVNDEAGLPASSTWPPCWPAGRNSCRPSRLYRLSLRFPFHR
jgi:trimethylamine--corrinoid protein Co-methyltransferase